MGLFIAVFIGVIILLSILFPGRRGPGYYREHRVHFMHRPGPMGPGPRRHGPGGPRPMGGHSMGHGPMGGPGGGHGGHGGGPGHH